MSSSLNIFYDKRVVGKLQLLDDSYEFDFEYDKEWIENGFVISPHISFDKKASSSTIKKFLDNLLPEGKGLEVFSLFFHISKNNTLALTKEIGNETAGALSFFENRQKIIKTSQRFINTKELSNRLKVQDPIQLIIWDGKPRLSVAGVQDKLPVIYHDKRFSFGEGDLASTHILKFETDHQRFLVLNEYICMKLAKMVNLNVAEVEIVKFDNIPALLIKRFDREMLNSSKVQRFHIIDGCQALDLPPTHKYEKNFGNISKTKVIRDGVSFKKLFDFANRCKNPIKTKLDMLRWAFFNLIISNSDAHGKNISFFIDRNGFYLTPFYDLVSIAMYSEFEQELSMAFGDNFSTDIDIKSIQDMSQDCKIPLKLALKELNGISNQILISLDKLEIDNLTSDEEKFIKKLKNFIKKRASFYKDISKS